MPEPLGAVKHDDLIFDVGMHKGEDTDYYLKKGFRVIAFEANPDLVTLNKERFHNEIKTKKLVIVEGAITSNSMEGGGNKTTKFYKNKDLTLWGTVDSDWALRNKEMGAASEEIEIPVVDFFGCVKKYGVPHYLKTDIEGMDKVCLQTLMRFEPKPNYISIESEKVSFDDLLDEFDLMLKLGYTLFKTSQQSAIHRQKEPKPSKEGSYIGHKFQHNCSGLFGSDLPGKWKNHSEIIKEYEQIFKLYRLFGDSGTMRKHFAGKTLRGLLKFFLQKPIPGYYDTHAKHESVT